MSVLILSCGRTGTNMLLEILRGSFELDATFPEEDKTLFKNCTKIHSRYLSKCDTVYVNNFDQVENLLELNTHLKILWTVRDWRDAALSKIYRGQPGQDTPILAEDATHKGCLEDVEWMSQVYNFISDKYKDRIKVVKMEDVILSFEDTIKGVCDFVGIKYNQNMSNFTERYRLQTKAKRYKKLDKSQVKIYERKYEIYDGFFKTHNIDLDSLFEDLKKYQKMFGYE